MSKTARLYRDTRTASAANSSGLDKLNDELQDVTRIMTKNMEELLWRGDSLDRALFLCCLSWCSHLSSIQECRTCLHPYVPSPKNTEKLRGISTYKPCYANMHHSVLLHWFWWSSYTGDFGELIYDILDYSCRLLFVVPNWYNFLNNNSNLINSISYLKT